MQNLTELKWSDLSVPLSLYDLESVSLALLLTSLLVCTFLKVMCVS